MSDTLTRATSLEVALTLVVEEAQRAQQKFPPFASKHEGLAIIEEEFLELREEVFWGERRFPRSDLDYDVKHRAAMKEEAVQLAAMALRFLVDVVQVQPEETK